MNEEYTEREFHSFVAKNFAGRVWEFIKLLFSTFMQYIAIFSAQKFVESLFNARMTTLPHSPGRVYDVTRNSYC